MTGIRYINPADMAKPRGYSHAIAVDGDHRTVYIGGQNAVDERGNLVGRGSLKQQTSQALGNIEKIMAAAGGTLENVVRFTIYVLQGQNPQDGFGAFLQKWGAKPDFPAVTVVYVAGLGHPEWLVEIDAIAVIPE